MNKIFVMLVALLLVSCANDKDNDILDKILSGNDDAFQPLLVSNSSTVGVHQNVIHSSNKLSTKNSNDDSTFLVRISTQYCADPSLKTERFSVIDQLLACYKANLASKNQWESCVVYVCQETMNTEKKVQYVNQAQKIIDEMVNEKEKNRPVVSYQNTVDTENSQAVVDAIKKLNMEEFDAPINPQLSRTILLQQARAGTVEINDKNLDSFCRMSSQMIYYITNNILINLTYDGTQSKTEKLGIINIQDSFPYKSLKITQERLSIMTRKITDTLPFMISLRDDIPENYQSSYYHHCLNEPSKFIFNYHRIFKPQNMIDKIFKK